MRLAKDIKELYSSLPELDRKSPKQVKLLLVLIEAKGKSVPAAELLHKTETSKAALDSLEKKGLVEIFEKEVDRRYKEHYEEVHQEFVLTDQQKKVIDEISPKIKESVFQSYLLHGVTGSGKLRFTLNLQRLHLNKINQF